MAASNGLCPFAGSLFLSCILQYPAHEKKPQKIPKDSIISGMQVPPTLVSRPRLQSLDFLRGLIMVLLILESTGFYSHLYHATEGQTIQGLFEQFRHHPWNGLRFWDLIQPGFMFMAGVSLAYSLHSQSARGVQWRDSFIKVLKRCAWLFFWGVLDYAVKPGGLSFELWDVLTQLSFTTLVAFLVFRWKPVYQILTCAGLLLLTEFLYRYTNIPGFNQPFTDQMNFGNYVDLLLMNKINSGGWVAINCIPTAVHTIAGALVGKLLLHVKKNALRTILLWSLLTILVGYGLDIAGVTPIIKRIATSSFVLASLGWCLCALAVSYWWIDVRKHYRYLLFFTIVGMNSLFIYIFIEIVAARWFNEYVNAIVSGLLGFLNTPLVIVNVAASLCLFAIEWGICYFLYRKKLFFRI